MWSFLVASCRWSSLSDLWIARSLLCRCPWDGTLKTSKVLLHLVSNGNSRETNMRSVKLSYRWICVSRRVTPLVWRLTFQKGSLSKGQKGSLGINEVFICVPNFCLLWWITLCCRQHGHAQNWKAQKASCHQSAKADVLKCSLKNRWKDLFLRRYSSAQSTDFSAWTSPRSSCPKALMLVWWGYHRSGYAIETSQWSPWWQVLFDASLIDKFRFYQAKTLQDLTAYGLLLAPPGRSGWWALSVKDARIIFFQLGCLKGRVVSTEYNYSKLGFIRFAMLLFIAAWSVLLLFKQRDPVGSFIFQVRQYGDESSSFAGTFSWAHLLDDRLVSLPKMTRDFMVRNEAAHAVWYQWCPRKSIMVSRGFWILVTSQQIPGFSRWIPNQLQNTGSLFGLLFGRCFCPFFAE